MAETTYSNTFPSGVQWALSRLHELGLPEAAETIGRDFWSLEERRQAAIRTIRGSGVEVLGDLSTTGYVVAKREGSS